MKKLLIILTLVFALLLSATVLVACGDEAGDVNEEEVATATELAPGPVIEDMNFDQLHDALEDLNMDWDSTIYEDVAQHLGTNGQIDENWSDDKTAATWYANDEGYVTVFFVKDTGLYSSWSSSGLGGWDDE